MHTLLVITEPGNNKSADALIAAAVLQDGKIPRGAARSLPPDLLSDDGTIPGDFCEAIRAAVQFHYLRVKGMDAPHLTPGLDFLTPAPR